jgi:hypothetical protein
MISSVPEWFNGQKIAEIRAVAMQGREEPVTLEKNSVIWRVISENKIDLAIANAENSAGGFGITPGIADELLSLGFELFSSALTFDECADLFVIVLESEDDGADGLQEVFGAEELDVQRIRRKRHVGGQILKTGIDQGEGMLSADDFGFAGVQEGAHGEELPFEALVPGDFARDRPTLRRQQLSQAFDELQPVAEQRAPGSCFGAALAEQPPGDRLGDSENFFEFAAADPADGQLL